MIIMHRSSSSPQQNGPLSPVPGQHTAYAVDIVPDGSVSRSSLLAASRGHLRSGSRRQTAVLALLGALGLLQARAAPAPIVPGRAPP